MYRVLIVDDQPVIRHGISAIINWEEEQMSLQDDCENGEEALQALEQSSFDILITDIKMPVMGGIELTKRALELYPSLKVILISSYSDFEYVREGLKLGATDYLLKSSLEPEELLTVLRRCFSLIEEERRKASELQDYLQGAIYRGRKIVEQEVKRMIVQEQPFPSPIIRNTAWMEKPYVCAYLMLDGSEEWKENHGYMHLQLLFEEMQELFYLQVEEGIALIAEESSLFLMLPDHDSEAVRQLCEWKQVLESKWEISTSAGYAREQGADNIIKGFASSRVACQRRFFEGIRGLYLFCEQEAGKGKPSGAAEEAYDWRLYYDIIRNGDPVSSAVEIALKRWQSGFLDPEQIKQEACDIHNQEGEELLLPEQLDMLRSAETLEQLVMILTAQLEEIKKPFVPNKTDNSFGAQIITQALDYIAAHYKESLSLQGVAGVVHVSKNYFCFLFKKHTGMNFMDYLIELRIREAKRLLVQNDQRIYDVAKSSGFKDVKYFSKMFKKVVGLTPLEYRNKHLV